MTIEPRTFTYNEDGDATIAGIRISDLAENYGSPLYILDEETLHYNCDLYLDNLKKHYKNSKVLYAGKANLNLAIAQFINNKKMCLDVSSGGELYTALQAGFNTKNIYFHGNNKSLKELDLAIHENISLIIDNEHELDNIISIVDSKKQKNRVPIMIRLKPEIEAHTHDYIKTGQLDSKFGIERQDLLAIAKRIDDHPGLLFLGIHSHIGSQIFDVQPYIDLVDILLEAVLELKQHNISITELNIGGGIGISYIKSDSPPDMGQFISSVTKLIKEKFKEHQLTLPTLLFEPGRSIIGNAGITLYKVGAIKEIKNVKTYLFVDGGMADNPRPMMYNSEYVFTIAKKKKATTTYSIAGKFCESSDILAENITLPPCQTDDIIIVFGTGAYNYSMASNYNRYCRPGMILVNDNEAKEIVQRESYLDLTRLDLPLDG
mgnify:CR=1 FL=1|tara:strand:+ start:3269 stop:4567 length:1299 start_codon:yes stop_codon:yes gene_type:complete